MMDYTKQEFRPLIYKDKEDIEEFDINDEKSIDAVMLKQIEGSVIIELDGANEYILDIFNNAHYITTLIMMEKHPVHFFRNYITIAEHAGSAYYDINEKNTYHQYFSAFTMGMVHNFLRMLDDKYNESNNIFINTLTKHFNRLFNSTGLDSEGGSLFFEIIAQIHKLKEYHIDKQSFTPRIIDKQAISDAEEYFGQKFSSWDMLIKNYGFKSSEEFAKKICRTDEEINLLTETIQRERMPDMLSSSNETFSQSPSMNAENRIKELQARVKELETELSELKAENTQLREELDVMQSPVGTPIETEGHGAVRIELLRLLMDKDGANWQKHGNKVIAARLIEAITGFAFKTCKNHLSDPHINQTKHQNEILETNNKLQALGMSIRL